MAESIEFQVFSRIKKSKEGTLYFVDNFEAIANAKSANKALERLVLSGELYLLCSFLFY